ANKIVLTTDMLIRRRDNGAYASWNYPDNETVWNEVNSFGPSIRAELINRLIKSLGDELDIISRESTSGGFYLAQPYQILNFSPLIGKEAIALIPKIEP